MDGPIYLDYNATTPVDPRVVDAMVPYLWERFGNASSSHAYGHQAQRALEAARRHVAALLGADAEEIVFTGGGSESDNLAVKGVVFPRLDQRPHVVATTVEHPAILSTLQFLAQRFGVAYDLVPVDEYGVVSAKRVREAIRPETVLVTVMHANNEVGSLQPIAEIAAYTREAGVLFHVDAAQSVGKVRVKVAELGVDMLTIAGHKCYAPKGIGALYVRQGIRLDPLIHGASQEHGMRAGTENVASIVGLGTACHIAREEQPEEEIRLVGLRDELQRLLEEKVGGIELNGHPTRRLPNTLNVSFPGVVGQEALDRSSQVAASTGAACHSGQTEPSSVLMAMGLSLERALGAVRLSLGRWSTEDEVERAAEALAVGFRSAARTSALR
jgi:cysteine desulfurase